MPTFTAPAAPAHPDLQKSYQTLKYAHDSAESFLTRFDTSRNGRRGGGTDEEQDLLRAMVVFAGAGLDSMVKRLIEDALPTVVESSDAARVKIETLVARHLRGSAGSDDDAVLSSIQPARLARVLMADNPRMGIAKLLIDDLTSGSLQSADELYRIGGYLGFDVADLQSTRADLKAVFDCRNRIIHEMDIDFVSVVRRNRFQRLRPAMVQFTETLLRAGSGILARVDRNLA